MQPRCSYSATGILNCRYGPRPSDRKTSFSEQGRLQCDVKLASFATKQRAKSFSKVEISIILGILPNWNQYPNMHELIKQVLYMHAQLMTLRSLIDKLMLPTQFCMQLLRMHAQLMACRQLCLM